MTKNYRPKLLALCLLSGISLATTAQETTPFKLKKVTSVEDRCIYAFEQLKRVMTTKNSSNVLNSSSIPSTATYKTENLSGNENYLWRIASKGNYFKIANYIVQNNCYLKVNNDNTDLSVESGSNFTWQFVSIGNDEFRMTGSGTKRCHPERGEGSGPDSNAVIGDQPVRLMKSAPRPFVPCSLNAGGAPPLKTPPIPLLPLPHLRES